METCGGDYLNRCPDVAGRMALLEAVPQRKGHFFFASRRRRKGFRLSGVAVEDSGRLRRLLGEGLRQRQPESAGVHSGPLLRFHHGGASRGTGIQRRAACPWAVHGAIVTACFEMPAPQKPRGEVFGLGAYLAPWV